MRPGVDCVDVTMQVFVKTLTGKIVTIDVSALDFVIDVKDKIQNKEFVDASYIRLSFQDKDLENDETLAVVKAMATADVQKITLVAREAFCV